MTLEQVAKLERKPFFPPQTGMERSVAKLVEHLRNATDSRSGFAAAEERAMAHAFWLETELAKRTLECFELRERLVVPVPTLNAEVKIEQAFRKTTVDWLMKQIWYRVILTPWQSQADDDMWARIRHQTFRKLMKELRREFEKTFPKTHPHRQR